MFELLKILSSFIVFPGIFVTIFGILGVYYLFKKDRSWLIFLILSALFYVISSGWFVYVVSRTVYIPDTEDRGEYIVILGGGVDEYRRNVEIGKHTLRRLYKAYQLYKEKPRKIVVTGGVVSKGTAEAHIMRDALVDFGVPEYDIIVEDKAKNTFQNAQYTNQLLGDVPITLVTSTSHMRRSILSFRKFFKEIYHIQADVPIDFRNSFLDYIPTYSAFYSFANIFYEWVGLIQYSIFKK
ncbi:YdcF family protein [Fervidobacterium sp.]